MTGTINFTEIGALLGALAALTTIVIFITNTWSKLYSPIKKRKEIKLTKYSNNYFEQINSNEFIFFRNKILEKYYDGYWTNINDRYFPVYTFEGVCYCQPFRELYDVNELDYNAPGDFTKNDYKKNKYYKKFKDSLYKKAKYPDKPCFMLKELILTEKEQKISHFTAWVGKYADNDYTSQILEYELYILFKKYKKFDLNKYSEMYKKLRIRNLIHYKKSMKDVLKTGCNRASLLGIQLIILLKNINEQYEVLIWNRQSEGVIVYPKYYQFPPAGVFDMTENSGNITELDIENSFSVKDVIYREFLEELYDKESQGTGIDGEEKNTDVIQIIENHPRIKEIENMLNDDLAFLEFLGTAVDLVNLRNDLCFVLRIDDANYLEKNKIYFSHNYEGGKHSTRPIEYIERNILKEKNVVPASVGIWHLLKRSHLFKGIS